MARELAPSGLNPRHEEVARLISEGNSQKAVAVLTGYSPEAISMLARKPDVARRIDELVMTRLRYVVAPRALRVLYDIAKDATADPRVRIAASNSILDRAGYTPKAAEDARQAKALEDTSSDQLFAVMQALQRELGNRARQTDSAPDSDPKSVTIDAKPLDPLD